MAKSVATEKRVDLSELRQRRKIITVLMMIIQANKQGILMRINNIGHFVSDITE
jgi:hypothetical protein